MEHSLQEREGGPGNLGGRQKSQMPGKAEIWKILECHLIGFIKGMNKHWSWRLMIYMTDSWPVEPTASYAESSSVSVFSSCHLCWDGLFSNTGAFESSLLLRSNPSLTFLLAVSIQTHWITKLHFLFFFSHSLVFILLLY